MKISVKRTYCRNCQRLVMGTELKSKEGIRITCPRCSKPIWNWNGEGWRYDQKVQ